MLQTYHLFKAIVINIILTVLAVRFYKEISTAINIEGPIAHLKKYLKFNF